VQVGRDAGAAERHAPIGLRLGAVGERCRQVGGGGVDGNCEDDLRVGPVAPAECAGRALGDDLARGDDRDPVGQALGLLPASDTWGRGLATEAATAARDDAFQRLALAELISIIHPENTRSRRLAGKLGMSLERQIDNPVLDRKVDVWQTSP